LLGILDAYFRNRAVGTLLRVERRHVEPGRSVLTHGTYRNTGPRGYYVLVEGMDMFPSVSATMLRGDRPGLFPDELVRAPESQGCTFKLVEPKSAGN